MTTPTINIRDQVLEPHGIRILTVYSPDGVPRDQIAAAVEQQEYGTDGTYWHITSAMNGKKLTPIKVPTEDIAREWLQFLFDLYNHAV